MAARSADSSFQRLQPGSPTRLRRPALVSTTASTVAQALGAVLCVALAGCGDGAERDAGSRPNVVLVVVDTLRADLAYDPLGLVEAPNLDALGAEALVFENAIVHAPMTLPSHVSLFSGRLPHQAGVVNNGVQVPAELGLLPDWMRQYGYESRAVVSLGTLNPLGEGPGLSRAFDSYDHDYLRLDDAARALDRMRASLAQRDSERPQFFFAHFADPHAPYRDHDQDPVEVTLALGDEPLDTVDASRAVYWQKTLTLEPGRHELVLGAGQECVVRDAGLARAGTIGRLPMEWVEGQRLKRWTQARLAWEVEEPGDYVLSAWISDVASRKEIRRRYVAEIEYLDEFLGGLQQLLKDEGLWDNSIVVFTSDHGEALGEHGHVGHVQGLTDEQIRVPLLMRLPESHPLRDDLAEVPLDRPFGMMDLAPTLVSLCGLPEMPGVAGVSLLDPERLTDAPVLSETYQPESKRNLLSLRNSRYKLIWDADADTWEMFDLQADPNERENVHAELGAQHEEWKAYLRKAYENAKARLRGEAVGETNDMLKALGY